MTDPNAWYRMPNWNFAHRLDWTQINTLCRRSVVMSMLAELSALPEAGEHDARCPTCSAILAEGAL